MSARAGIDPESGDDDDVDDDDDDDDDLPAGVVLIAPSWHLGAHDDDSSHSSLIDPRQVRPGLVPEAAVRESLGQTVGVTSHSPIERTLPWMMRLTWVGVLLLGGSAVDASLVGRSDGVRWAATWGGAAMWSIAVAAMAIPAVTSLTAMRILVPLSIPSAVAAWIMGAPAVDTALFAGTGALATIIAFSGEIGGLFVQASAYGEEDRHLLRPPAAYLLAALITWCTLAAASISAVLLLGAERWVIGSALGAGAISAGVWAWPRLHRLSRRWFVVVPVGLVIHDYLVLAETLMLRRAEIAGVRLAPNDTQAADLTGPAAGHAIEINTVEPVTAIFAATPKQPRGTAIHLTACLVSPTRPGRALAAAERRRLKVG